MPNIRIYELAKTLAVENKEILSVLLELGIKGKTSSSGIDEKTVDMIKERLKKSGKSHLPKKEPKKTSALKAPKREPKGAVLKPQIKPEKEIKVDVPSVVVSEEKVVKAPEPPLEQVEKEVQEEKQPPPIEKDVLLLEEEVEMKVPLKFKKDIETEKVEKFKAKPGMHRAFQAIRKIEHKRHEQRLFKRHPKGEKQELKEENKQILITAPRKKTLKINEGTTVKEFAELIGMKVSDITKKFMELGYMPSSVNQSVDLDAAVLAAQSMGIKLEVASIEEEVIPEEVSEDVSALLPRPPVITVMGHVDHGKTSLLDAIKQTKVTETEFGGITQHIGAYKVSIKGKEIVFLDTPGHAAFTTLRARGAKVTDIVVLVVAADDGVKPQTIEAINHAKAANVPIIVAINKIDKPEANVSKVKGELAESGIISEEWGGQNIFTEVSAKKRIGIEHLLEMILLQAEVMELKANPNKMARGSIIESRLDKGRGPVATVLVQSGKLKVGDAFLSGVNAGRVRALADDTGKRLGEAGPSTPVEVIGFGSIPQAGDPFIAMEDERKARHIALLRLQKQRFSQIKEIKRLTLDELYSKIKEGQIKELNIVIKGDVQGSVEAMKSALEGITHPEVKIKVIHSSVGGINESDVMLSAASNAIVIGFNVRPESKASQIAEKEGVDLRLYKIIYDAIEDVKKALEGLLEPTLKEKVLGRAEVRQTFQVSKIGTIAGCYVTDGTVLRTSDGIRVIRDSIVIHEGKIASLKRFKEDVREVQAGYECGITIENFNDIKVGDIIENYVVEKIAAKL
ncbi:MAG: translation initiation factor IF-2 [Nitrospirae bacterium]|nr:translation initiation factor IF-2 [Nitrospirota bacterium]